MSGQLMDFSNMSMDIEILNKEELEWKKYEDELYKKLYSACDDFNKCNEEIERDKPLFKKLLTIKESIGNQYNELLDRYNKGTKSVAHRRDMPSIRTVDNLKSDIQKLQKEIILTNLTADQEDPLNVNQFRCLNCRWGATGTLVGAPEKCSSCGGKELERAVIVNKSGKVKSQEWIKFNPDSNIYKKVSHNQEADINEKIDKLTMEIEKKLKSTIKEKEDKPMERKTYVVKCTGDKCGFAYETNDAPSGSHQHKWCPVCKKSTSHTEKQPEKKISRFDR
jgi:hypothetical protein